MPDIYDLELLKTIRDQNKDLPIVLCTVYKKVQDNPTIGASGVAGYFIKPFGINRLKATVWVKLLRILEVPRIRMRKTLRMSW